MDAKPFTLQAPEQIATQYGGNKQKIAQAAQMGMVDPTAAVMAGMFIDRMRAAQQAEQKPQPTVAQQVMAPPAPPQGPSGGLGALPQGGGPPPGGPPQGGPEPAGMVPQGAPAGPPTGPPGMAGGGLLSAGIPDDMYDSYATGGLVSFPHGGLVPPDITGSEEDEYLEGDPRADQLPPPVVPPRAPHSPLNSPIPGQAQPFSLRSLMPAESPPRSNVPVPFDQAPKAVQQGTPKAAPPVAPPVKPGDKSLKVKMSGGDVPGSAIGTFKSALPDTKPAQTMASYLEPENFAKGKAQWEKAVNLDTTQLDAAVNRLNDPERKKKEKSQDVWQTLFEIGANMAAGQSHNALTNVGAAVAAAAPGMAERVKERRKGEKEDMAQLLAIEGQKNQQKIAAMQGAMQYTTAFMEAHDKDLSRADKAKQDEFENWTKTQTLKLTERGQNIDMAMKKLEIAASERNARTAAGGRGGEHMPPEFYGRLNIIRSDVEQDPKFKDTSPATKDREALRRLDAQEIELRKAGGTPPPPNRLGDNGVGRNGVAGSYPVFKDDKPL